jgi:hypothetical protein
MGSGRKVGVRQGNARPLSSPRHHQHRALIEREPVVPVPWTGEKYARLRLKQDKAIQAGSVGCHGN